MGTGAGRRGGCLPIQWASHKLPEGGTLFHASVPLLTLFSPREAPPSSNPVSLEPSQLSFVPPFLLADPSRLNQPLPLLATHIPPHTHPQYVWLTQELGEGGGGEEYTL